MSSSNQIIQQSGKDIERSYNTELFIDSSAKQNNSGLIYIMRMKSSPLSRNITLMQHGCLYFSPLSNEAALVPMQKWYQSGAHSSPRKVYRQGVALHNLYDLGTVNIVIFQHQYSLWKITWVVRGPCVTDELPKNNYGHSIHLVQFTNFTPDGTSPHGARSVWTAGLCSVFLVHVSAQYSLQPTVLEKLKFP